MARIKFGAIVTEGVGSLGGHTFQNSKGGPQLRTKPIPRGKPSAAQRLIRSFNPILQNGWQSLSELQRSIWNQFAVSHNVVIKSGGPYPMSGHSLFMKLNYVYVSQGFPLEPDVYQAFNGPLGSELLLNGSFLTSASWMFVDSFSFIPGFAHYISPASGSIRQAVTLPIGTDIRLSFVVSSAPGNAVFRILNNGGAFLFEPPNMGNIIVANGSHVLFATLRLSTTLFWLNTAVGSTSFDITDISFKVVN